MRIVTYNTRGSLGLDEKRSTTRIAETVRILTPDIICFQEIHQRLAWSGREDQPQVLSQLLARPFYFQRNLRFGFGGYGVGICARGTLVAKREHLLPSGKEQRGLLEVHLRDVGGFRTLAVFCTHWGLEAGEREAQAQASIEILRNAPRPLVLCGDFNETPEAPSVRRLLDHTGLVDSDAVLDRPTFVADNPTARIDLILHSPDVRASNAEVIDSHASDHRPVLADIWKT